MTTKLDVFAEKGSSTPQWCVKGRGLSIHLNTEQEARTYAETLQRRLDAEHRLPDGMGSRPPGQRSS